MDALRVTVKVDFSSWRDTLLTRSISSREPGEPTYLISFIFPDWASQNVQLTWPEQVRELCFDLSRFNSNLYRVSDFVDSLIHNDENENLLLYEETLLYAEFPALDSKVDDRETFRDNTYLIDEHEEVFDILDWLRTKKEVQRIIELKVLDRMVNPHNEERIAAFVKDFGVERLNWRCLDLSLSVFGPNVANDKTSPNDEIKVNDKIKELHLYSSGRRAAIDHWLGSDGIPTLTKVSLTIFRLRL